MPIFDEFKEVTYIERCFYFFDPRILQFVTADLIKQDTEGKYNDKSIKLDKEDRFYPTKLNSLNAEKLQIEKWLKILKRKKKKEKEKKIKFS